ncbi:MAG: hypothetical protein JXB49_08295 [Bacteroidales bacterium]|nr:hypothetical protein [Bacteroidales bacterium]
MKKQLIFMITVSIIISCGNGEPGMINSQIDYITKNTSIHNVKIIIFYENVNNIKEDTIFSIPPNLEIIQRYINQIVDCPFGLPADSANIVFNDQKQITYRKNDGKSRNILDVNNYTGGLVKDEWYQYQYFITDEDYNNSIPIK